MQRERGGACKTEQEGKETAKEEGGEQRACFAEGGAAPPMKTVPLLLQCAVRWKTLS